MPLNDLVIRNTKPLAKAYKLSDEKGLFFLVHPNGSRYWRLKYYFLGKEVWLELNQAIQYYLRRHQIFYQNY